MNVLSVNAHPMDNVPDRAAAVRSSASHVDVSSVANRASALA
jgi:hypothetical protein